MKLSLNMPKRINDKITPPSEDFIDAVCHSACAVVDCGFCGRMHFASSANFDFEEGELEGLLENAEKYPDKYINHGNVPVSNGYIGGVSFVADCPCNEARKYEDFIWNSRYIIERYLNNRANSMAKQTTEAQETAQSISKAVDSSYKY